jgi:hypothetical protein
VADVERDLILDTLDHTLGNRTHAANILGISIRTLRNKLNQYADEGTHVPGPGEQRNSVQLEGSQGMDSDPRAHPSPLRERVAFLSWHKSATRPAAPSHASLLRADPVGKIPHPRF